MFLVELDHPTRATKVHVAVSQIPADLKAALEGSAEEKENRLKVVHFEAAATLQTQIGIYHANFALRPNEVYDGNEEAHVCRIILTAVQFFLAKPEERAVVIFPTYFPPRKRHQAYAECIDQNWAEATRLQILQDAKLDAEAPTE
jgi:hypothetical protein